MQERRKFNLYDYNGEYPRKMDGSRIKTYTPEIYGGEREAQFNGHSWNHAPYLKIRPFEMHPPYTNSGAPELNINIASLLTNPPIEACVFEDLFIQMPLREGVYVFSGGLYKQGFGAVFRSINCDAGKDEYHIDPAKRSWIDLKRYNRTTRELEVEFHLNFLIQVRNSNFGPIYPKEVKLTGRSKMVAALFK